MASMWDKLIYKNPEEEQQKREEKKVKDIPAKAEPLVTGPTSPAYNNTPNFNGGGYTPVSYAPALPQEEVTKCQNYFGKLLAAAREQNKSYNQFLASMETVSKTDPNQPIANVVKLAFGFLKMQIPTLTKDTLLADMNNALTGIVGDKTTDFKAKQDKRQKEGVDDNTAMINKKMLEIQQKQQEIQKLNEDIIQLQTTVAESKQTIEMKSGVYDLVSNQVISRVKEEINLVTNYIQQ
jgi:flagellar motility protein MotE (MotC chaperone)